MTSNQQDVGSNPTWRTNQNINIELSTIKDRYFSIIKNDKYYNILFTISSKKYGQQFISENFILNKNKHYNNGSNTTYNINCELSNLMFNDIRNVDKFFDVIIKDIYNKLTKDEYNIYTSQVLNTSILLESRLKVCDIIFINTRKFNRRFNLNRSIQLFLKSIEKIKIKMG